MVSHGKIVPKEKERGSNGFLEVPSRLRKQIEKRTASLEAQHEKDPQDFETQHALGILQMTERRWDIANEYLDSAYRLNPQSLEVQINTAAILARRGRYRPALDLLEKAHQAWPGSPLVLFKQAVTALEARQPVQALRAVEQMERLCKANPTASCKYHDAALTLRGLALLLQGQLPQAKEALDSAAQHLGATPLSAAPELSDKAISNEATSPSQQPDEADHDENHAEAEDLDFDACPLKSGEADMHNNLSIVEAAMGNSIDAIRRLGLALKLEPEHPQVHNNLGVIAYQHGHLNLALRHMELTLHLEEATGDVRSSTHNHLGVVYAALGNRSKSSVHFRQAGGYERMEFETYYNLGRSALEAARQAEAVSYLRHSHGLNARNADLHVLMGIAYMTSRKSELKAEALKSFKNALQLQPEHYIAMVNLALALLEAAYPAETVEKVIRQVHKMHPEGGEARFLHGLLLLQGDDEDTLLAQRQFALSSHARPDLLAATYNFALCEYCAGAYQSAVLRLQGVLKSDACFGPAYYLLGFGHMRAKRHDEALEAWLKAVAYEPDNADLQANLGFVYYQLGEWLKAAAAYDRAHKIAPDQIDLLSCIGLCYARAGNQMNEAHEANTARRANPLLNMTKQQKAQNEANNTREIKDWTEVMYKAIMSFTIHLQHQPNDPILHSNLGVAHWYNKEVEKAIGQWRIVGKLDPRYAARLTSAEEHTYDESGLAFRPFNWRRHVAKIAPLMPRPQLRLIPVSHEPALNPVTPDPESESLSQMRYKLDCTMRALTWNELSHEKKNKSDVTT